MTNPLTAGAVAPSRRSLARLITSGFSPETGPVLELGPGTGVFSRALLERGVAPRELTLVESDPDFANLLEERFPNVRVVCMDTARLPQFSLFERAHFGAVVSGLPLLSIPPHKVMLILSGAFQLMRPEASFFQFTYGPCCPVPRSLLDRLGLKARLVGRTFWNVPPAAAYRVSQRPPFLPTTKSSYSEAIMNSVERRA